jgi:tetratricopeptide (TPR) repeat protein
VGALLRVGLPEAFAHAARAATLDSTYLLPRVMRAYLHADLRQWPEAEAAVRALARHEGALSPVEYAGYDLVRADVAGDLEGALRAAQELQRLAPTSTEADVHVAQRALAVNRPRLALAALAPLDPRRGVLLVAPFYWNARTAALHLLGDHAAELDAARHEQRQFPTRNATTLNLARALGARGRVDEAAAAAEDGVGERWAADAVRRRALVEASRELRAHGHADGARALLAAALDAPEVLPPALPAAAADEQRALLLAEAGRWAAARALAERVRQAAPARPDAQGVLGVAAARSGDRAAAARADAALAELHPAARARGRATMWRARIAAALAATCPAPAPAAA